jgi:hypothetical protein
MNLDDRFGAHPGRPDHPDFVRLVEIVNEQDDHATLNLNDSAMFEEHLSHFIDPTSITYMAMQRALRAAPGGSSTVHAALASLYLDAFMVGYLYRDETKEDADG